MSLVSKILVVFLLFSNIAYSQLKKYPTLNVIDGDTVLIFDLFQGKELIKINETKKQYIELFDLNKKELERKNTIISVQEDKIRSYEYVIKDYDTIVKSMGNLITLSEQKIREQKKEIRKQKTHKWVAIIGLSCLGILGVIY